MVLPQQSPPKEERLGAFLARVTRNFLVPAAIVCAIVLPVLLTTRHRSLPPSRLSGSEDALPKPPAADPDDLAIGRQGDKLQQLAGLLADGFDDGSCRSRYRYRNRPREQTYRPSEYLIRRLREQEDLQRKCGPGTDAYKRAAGRLRSGAGEESSDEFGEGSGCRYVVTVVFTGLGNKMLSAMSAFLYALLTSRVLLADLSDGSTDELFCEPFPGTSWLIPDDFPIRDMNGFDFKQPRSFGNLLQSGGRGTFAGDAGFVYLPLEGGASTQEKLFYCEDYQALLHNVTWLVMRSNIYLVPQLMAMPAFREELAKLFPEKDAMFHLSVRYLFHPSNKVWSMITQYYNEHLAGADEIVGFQIRNMLYSFHPPVDKHFNELLQCTRAANLLPPETDAAAAAGNRTKAILIASLSSSFAEKFRALYNSSSGGGGESMIKVYQPSKEGSQKFGDKEHNMKALMDMYLLSMSDKLVTTPLSTFGYLAQGIGGLKPWLVTLTAEPEYDFDLPCTRMPSPEPCMHTSFFDCKARRDVDRAGRVAPFVRHCQDMRTGIKIVSWD